jgi:hypothetical protein
MMNLPHSGFNVYWEDAIWPHNQERLENLARYIIRASFSQERMKYILAHESSDSTAKVVYQIPAADYLFRRKADYPTDSWIRFTDHFEHAAGAEPRTKELLTHIYACIIGPVET